MTLEQYEIQQTQLRRQLTALRPKFKSSRTTQSEVKNQFAEDIAQHQMYVVRDDGYTHRRLRASNGSFQFAFDIGTMPGLLAVHGDLGSFMFACQGDPFTMFRSENINPYYWASKAVAGATHEYSEDVYRQLVIEATEQSLGHDDLEELDETDVATAGRAWATVNLQLLEAGSTETEARAALESWDAHAIADTRGSEEWDLRDYTRNFLRCCHAIRVAVAAYDREARTA